MKFSQLLKTIENSQEFGDFKKQNPLAVLCAGFFILDFSQNREDYNLDYKSAQNIFSFALSPENNIIFKQEELIDSPKPLNEINQEIKFAVDLPDLQKETERILLENGIKSRLEKIIAILQNTGDRTIYNLTCICSNFIIILIQIDASTGETIKFERKKLFDFIDIKKKDQ